MLSYRVERDRDRELQKTIAVYSESPSEKSISSLLVFNWVTIAADQEKKPATKHQICSFASTVSVHII